jgi:hypothetical protein
MLKATRGFILSSNFYTIPFLGQCHLFKVGSGDSLLGDTLRSTVAAVCVNALLDSACSRDFAVVNTDGTAPSEVELSGRISALA